MTSRLLIRAGLVGAVGLFSLGLIACGKQGSLDRPGPLFGSARSEHRAMRDAASHATSDPNAGSATSQTNGDYTQTGDRSKDPALIPPRTAPPPGANNNGLGNSGGAGGVLPDPYADPNRAPR